MFDERRHRITAGIDKSYLLAPIAVETKTSTTSKRVIAPSKPMRMEQKMSNYSKVIVPPLQNRLISHADVNGNSSFSVSDDPLNRTFGGGELARNVAKPPAAVKMSSTTRKLTPAVSSPPPLKNLTNQKVKLTAVNFCSATEKTFSLQNFRWVAHFLYQFSQSKASPSRSMKSGNSTTSSTTSARSMMSPKVVSSGATRTTAAASAARAPPLKKENTPQSSIDELDDAPVPEGLVKCGICKRNFAEDRIEKHSVICQKNKTKKRRVYDASKKRVEVTIVDCAKINLITISSPLAGNWSWDLLEEANCGQPSFKAKHRSNEIKQSKLAHQARGFHQNDSSCQGDAGAFGQRWKTLRLAASASFWKSGLRSMSSLRSTFQRICCRPSHPAVQEHAAQ